MPHPDGGTCPPLAHYAQKAGWKIGVNILRTLEARPLDDTLTLVDGDRIETMHCAGEPVTWPEMFVGGEMPVPQGHVFAVHDICLRAQGMSTTRPTA